jgi:hypothetical protein
LVKEEWEAHLAHRTVLQNEGRPRVARACYSAGDDRELWIYRRAAAAYCRLSMAHRTAIFVETGTETAISDSVNFLESIQSVIEERQAASRIVRSHRCQRTTSTSGPTADSGVGLCECHSG